MTDITKAFCTRQTPETEAEIGQLILLYAEEGRAISDDKAVTAEPKSPRAVQVIEYLDGNTVGTCRAMAGYIDTSPHSLSALLRKMVKRGQLVVVGHGVSSNGGLRPRIYGMPIND
jgi:hypothetical protein